MFMRRHLISGKNRPGSALSVKSITIHETANPAEGADAAMHRDYAQRNDRNVSYHWVVDDKEAIQVIPDTEIAWHSGTAEGNRTSLSIEICENRDGDPVARYEHAVWLSAYLLHKHGLGTEELVTHKHWSGKDCPRHLLNVWDTFKKDVNEQLRSMKKQKTPILGSSVAAAEQMRQYLKSIHPQAPDYVSLYLQMEKEEGVRADVAFAQSILETNAWRFGGTVTPDMNNFAGLGASENPPAIRLKRPEKGSWLKEGICGCMPATCRI